MGTHRGRENPRGARETQSGRGNRLQTVKSFMQSIRSHEIIGAAGENNNHRPKSIKKITSLQTVARSPSNQSATGARLIFIPQRERERQGGERTHTHTQRERERERGMESEIGGLVLAAAWERGGNTSRFVSRLCLKMSPRRRRRRRFRSPVLRSDSFGNYRRDANPGSAAGRRWGGVVRLRVCDGAVSRGLSEIKPRHGARVHTKWISHGLFFCRGRRRFRNSISDR